MKTFEFRSLSKASFFLGRNHGYVSGVLKSSKRKEIKDKEGNLYKAI